MKPKTVWDFFEHTCGSPKGWPSDGKDGSTPFDDFKCKLCGMETTLQMYGSCFIGEPDFRDKAEQELLNHLKSHHPEELKQLFSFVDKSEEFNTKRIEGLRTVVKLNSPLL